MLKNYFDYVPEVFKKGGFCKKAEIMQKKKTVLWSEIFIWI